MSISRDDIQFMRRLLGQRTQAAMYKAVSSEQKDLDRLHKIYSSAPDKQVRLCQNMANKITDLPKAVRRALACIEAAPKTVPQERVDEMTRVFLTKAALIGGNANLDPGDFMQLKKMGLIGA